MHRGGNRVRSGKYVRDMPVEEESLVGAGGRAAGGHWRSERRLMETFVTANEIFEEPRVLLARSSQRGFSGGIVDVTAHGPQHVLGDALKWSDLDCDAPHIMGEATSPGRGTCKQHTAPRCES